MSNHLNLPNNEVNPNFEVISFTSEPQFHADWKKDFDPGSGFLCHRFWRLRNDETLKVVNSVGNIMLGIAVKYPEFTGIGNAVAEGGFTENGVTYKAGYITPATDQETLFLNPERTAKNLIEATNEQLLVLGSPYQLPIE